tara:strand:- start:339 stop:839 length:501 start_codon:yes stop_codon:yes gene_type:complete
MTKRELVAHADLAANQLLSKGHSLVASYIKAINKTYGKAELHYERSRTPIRNERIMKTDTTEKPIETPTDSDQSKDSSDPPCSAFVEILDNLPKGFYLCGAWVKLGYKEGVEWRQAVAEWDKGSWLLYECGYLAMSGEMEWFPTHCAGLPESPPMTDNPQMPITGV